MKRLRLGTLVLVFGLLSACGEAPTFGSSGPFEIVDLEVNAAAPLFHPGGAISLRAMLADTSQILGPGAGLTLRVFATSGDRETVRLKSALCPVRKNGGFQYGCLGFVIVMEDGEDVRVLEPRLREWGGRFRTVAPRLWFASVLVVRQDGMVHRLSEIEQWPGVRSAHPVGPPAIIGHGPFPPQHSRLHTTLALEDRVVRAGDGELQAAVGDTVHFAYVQPSGDVLSVSAVVQSKPDQHCPVGPC